MTVIPFLKIDITDGGAPRFAGSTSICSGFFENWYNAQQLLETARQRLSDNPLKNALAAFYLQPNHQGGSVEFVHKSFSEFLCAERLKISLAGWAAPGLGYQEYAIQTEQMDWEIYDLLGFASRFSRCQAAAWQRLSPSSRLATRELRQLIRSTLCFS